MRESFNTYISVIMEGGRFWGPMGRGKLFRIQKFWGYSKMPPKNVKKNAKKSQNCQKKVSRTTKLRVNNKKCKNCAKKEPKKRQLVEKATKSSSKKLKISAAFGG